MSKVPPDLGKTHLIHQIENANSPAEINTLLSDAINLFSPQSSSHLKTAINQCLHIYITICGSGY
ncbi:hypothetical protein clem_08250 [Legionella clemsonensis]|uniref:Uncharacterized protein n=1 Tax=Legionella clemsonensis TaxID=1867846 RepID=A0A222P2Z0_9GAMM|nr:hypothetical protein clem_08250 [Legionella clemsonensis]